MEYYLETNDFLVSGESFYLLADADGNTLKTHPVPENISTYYQSEKYISHTDSNKGFLSRCYQLVKKYNIKQKIRLINRYAGSEKSLFDFGAGTADLLVEARKNNYEIAGLEPNIKARETAKSKGIDLWDRLRTGRRFQIITLWHVLEHLEDPVSELLNLTAILEDDGTVFIAVPNFKSYDANYYKEYWAAFDVPRHIWHFSRQGITEVLKEAGLEVIETKPMWADSFYISLLSEKYKGKLLSYPRAFFIGLMSNWKARRTKEYSSLLYIAKKSKQNQF